MSYIDKTAIIEKGAEIDENVKIGPFCYIGSHVKIGSGSVLESSVRIVGDTVIGQNNFIGFSAYIGGKPQDLSFINTNMTRTLIGDNNIIREFVTIHRGTKDGSSTIVGNHNFIMGNAHLAHNVHLHNNIIIANFAGLTGYVEVDDNAFISGLSAIHQFVKIGRNVMLGGGSKIVKDVPPYCMADGNPGRIVGLNVVGIKRSNLTKEERSEIKKCFKILYNKSELMNTNIKALREMPKSIIRNQFIDFINRSERGLLRAI